MAEPRDPATPTPPGLLATVSAAVAAGLTVGLLFGTLDALVAGVPGLVSEGETRFALGCLAASVMTYSVAATIVLVLAGALLHPFLQSSCEKKRLRRLLILGSWLALWIDLAYLGRWLLPGDVSSGAAAVGVEVVVGMVALIAGVGLARLLVRFPSKIHALMRTLAVIAIAGGWFFTQQEEPRLRRPGTIGERNAELPNVLLLIADTLSADQLGCYGEESAGTPNLDGLAGRGVVVEACYAPSSNLVESFDAIVTGSSARRGRGADTLAVHLGLGRRRDGGALKEWDYATALFWQGLVPGTPEAWPGVACDSHRALDHGRWRGELTWRLFRAGLSWQILEDRIFHGPNPDPAASHARLWLAGMEGRRWLAVVSLRGESGAPAVDAKVGELLGVLEDTGAGEETLVVFTAMRGAAVVTGEPLRAAAVRVPLILANTRRLPHDARFGGIVESVDVVPTVLDLLDLELPDEEEAVIDGRSFLPGILGTQRGEADTFRPKRFAFAEDDEYLSILDGNSQLIASRNLFDRDTVPADDALLTLLEASTSLQLIDLAAVADEASSPELAVVRTLWSELRRFQNTNPTRNKPGPDGFPEGSDPGRAEENNE